MQLDHVRTVQLPEKHDLPVGSLSVSRVRKCVEVLFESICFASGNLLDFPDYAIGPAAYFLDDFVLLEDVLLYVLAHEVIGV